MIPHVLFPAPARRLLPQEIGSPLPLIRKCTSFEVQPSVKTSFWTRELTFTSQSALSLKICFFGVKFSIPYSLLQSKLSFAACRRLWFCESMRESMFCNLPAGFFLHSPTQGSEVFLPFLSRTAKNNPQFKSNFPLRQPFSAHSSQLLPPSLPIPPLQPTRC